MKTEEKISRWQPEWLENLPANWKIVPLKAIFDTAKERVGDRSEEYELLRLALDGVFPKGSADSGKNPADYNSYQVFNEDDLVFCAFDYDVTPRTIGHVREPGMMTGAYTRLIPKEAVYPRYYYYYYLALDRRKILLHLCTGLRNTLGKHVLWKLPNPYPDLETQKRIVNYLDEKLARVNQVIEKKKKLIELLKEKRTSIITQAVTKGLDPNAKMKDSGVEWIGQIPEKWKVRRLKLVANVVASNVDKNSKPHEENVLLCNYTDVYNNELLSNSSAFMKSTASDSQIAALTIRKGDVIITKDSETSDDIGVPALVVKEFIDVVCGYHLYLIRPDSKRLIGDYLLRLLQAVPYRSCFDVRSNGVTRMGLGSYAVKNTSILMPSLKEQERISEELSKVTNLIDKAVSSINSQIYALKEYQVSLVSSVVIGRIKV